MNDRYRMTRHTHTQVMRAFGIVALPMIAFNYWYGLHAVTTFIVMPVFLVLHFWPVKE